MKTFELALNLSISKKINPMNNYLPWVDFCHRIRYFMSRVIAFVNNGYVQLLFEVLYIIFLNNFISFMEIRITVCSFHRQTNKNGFLHLIKAFSQYCRIDFLITRGLQSFDMTILGRLNFLFFIFNLDDLGVSRDLSESCSFDCRGHAL